MMVIMSYDRLLVRSYSRADLTPVVEGLLLEKGFDVSILANRINGEKKTGWFSSENITIFLENFPDGCIIRISGTPEIAQNLKHNLSSLPPNKKIATKETIIKEREIVSIPCPYCRTLVPITEKRCPNCGAYVRG